MTVAKLAKHSNIAVITIDSPPVNALGARVRGDLLAAIKGALADDHVAAVVIAAAGKIFIAGADISEFGKPPLPPSLPELFQAIEDAQKPVVAALHGAALGGGLELALSCHARIAGTAAKMGLPEVKLGLIPGAGGTQRLSRLVGAAQAFPMMLSGEPVDSAKALEMGLVDELATGDLVGAAIALASKLAGARTTRRLSEDNARLTEPDRKAFEALAASALKTSSGSPNVAALVAAVRNAFILPFSEALTEERRLFAELVTDPRSQALRHLFFAEREATKTPSHASPRAISRAAVVGAGTMGAGIAMCFANAGIPVTLIEQEQTRLDAGINRVRGLYDMSLSRGSLTAEQHEMRLAMISPALGITGAADADIVVEAAFEDMDVKREIFAALDRVAKPGAILASNTSYLDISAIAAATSRAPDVLGMHFFSPANVMKLLEIVRPANAAEDTIATAVTLGRRLGKVPVVVGNAYGFVGNRMLEQRQRAAERLLMAGALPHEVDAALVGFGFKMGPFAMSDLAGNDIGWRTRKSRGKTAAIADAICEAGWFGQKTGRGYYVYPNGARIGERCPDVEALICTVSRRHGIVRRTFTQQDILSRLLAPMVNEGARILEEKIAARPGDIDVIWLYGYNWPASRGGPMHWADAVGLDVIIQRLADDAAESGDATLEPAPLLRQLAAEGKGFASLKAVA